MIPDAIVYIVDDDAGMGASIESLLASVGYRTRCFPTAELFLAHPRDDVPACLILDVRLRGQSGLELQRELLRTGKDLPVIFVTGHGDVPMSVAAMKAGAIEFLMKPFRDQDLLDAVRLGLERSRQRRDAAAGMTLLRQRHATLTPRERQVLPLVASGLMNKQVAEQLNLSEVTVKVHRAQIMQKLGARSMADLVRIADRLARDDIAD
jgi:FixJ family two-component response regulator